MSDKVRQDRLERKIFCQCRQLASSPNFEGEASVSSSTRVEVSKWSNVSVKHPFISSTL